MSATTDFEIIELAFDVLEDMEVQHEFEDFYVVHVSKDAMDRFNKTMQPEE